MAVIPEWIGELKFLQLLSLGNNKFTNLPSYLSKLQNLDCLILDNSHIGKLPSPIRTLKNLKQLQVENSDLQSLPDWLAELTQISSLYLSHNCLTDSPTSLGQLSNLKELDLHDNPLNPDLAAAYEQGSEAVLQYLQAKAENQVTLNGAKLILIGEGEVGKTCFLGALRGDEWVGGRPTTHGIEIKPVIVTDADTGTEITLNGWDFGGQRVYRPTHQLFFSAPAVYL